MTLRVKPCHILFSLCTGVLFLAAQPSAFRQDTAGMPFMNTNVTIPWLTAERPIGSPD